jgi:spore coat protein U-like protein
MKKQDGFRRWRSGLRIGALTTVLLLPGLRAQAASSCFFVSVTGVSFGAYDVLDRRPATQIGTVTFRCRSTDVSAVPVTIELSPGSSGTYTVRQTRRGNKSLRYNLHLDAGNNQVLGDGTSGSFRFGPLLAPDNMEITVTIYGRLLPRQNIEAGSYSDTITATLRF